MKVTSFQSLVRPAVTAGLVGAQIALAGLWALHGGDAEKAFAGLMPLSSTTLMFWFKSRDETEQNGGR